jgi:mannose-6-phosphate isomerase-like protein (cupin superfamily)
MVFSVGLEYFFSPDPRPVLEIVRRKDRLRFPDTPNASKTAYFFESLDFPVPNRALHSYLAEFESVESQPHEHAGIELLYVLSGRMQLRTGEDKYALGEGDAVYFDSLAPHSYVRIGARRTTALVVALEARAS